MVYNYELNKFVDRIPYRTPSITKDTIAVHLRYAEMGDTNNANEVLTDFSMHPRLPFILGFFGEDDSIRNPFQSLMVETMHQADLGIQIHLFECLRKLCSNSTLTKMDERMNGIRKSNTIPGFRLPANGYFLNKSFVQAHEHKSVLQIVCACIQGLVSDDIVNVFKSYHEWYVAAVRKYEFSEEDLVELREKTKKFIDICLLQFGAVHSSNFQVIKFHALNHYEGSIRRGGGTREYCANMFEYLHTVLMKGPYRKSNKNNSNVQIMDNNILDEVLDDLDEIYNQDEDDDEHSLDLRISVLKKV
jgi:hypothetical protein